MEYKSTESYRLAFATAVSILTTCSWLIITRGTYSIDIMGGLIFGHYFWIICERFSWMLDFEWFRSPFHLRHPNFQKKCAKCLDPINEWAWIGSEQSTGFELENLQGKQKGFPVALDNSIPFEKPATIGRRRGVSDADKGEEE